MQDSAPKKFGFTAGRLWDAVATLAIAFVIWKMLVAPRFFIAPHEVHAPRAVYDRLDGGSFRLEHERGKIVFLDFFTTWCSPCKTELPSVEAWAAGHPQAVVVAVDVGERRPIVAQFARQLHLRDVALDPKTNARALFGIQGFPTIVVIDRRGDIRAKWEGLNPAIGSAMTNAQASL